MLDQQQRFAHRARHSVTVVAGATTANFSRNRRLLHREQSERDPVTATVGTSSQTATISTLLAPVLVSGVVCDAASLGQSAVITCTATLTQFAPAGGSSVMLTSSNASLTVPGFGHGSRRQPQPLLSAPLPRLPSRAIRALP